MNANAKAPLSSLSAAGFQASPDAIPQLVAEIYESAPMRLRVKLLEQLIRPLGVLALVAISNGIFAKIRFKSGWPDMHIRFEDVQNVQPNDVVALVTRLQQVSQSSFDGLTKMLATSPVLAGSAAAAVLLTMLLKTTQHHHESDGLA